MHELRWIDISEFKLETQPPELSRHSTTSVTLCSVSMASPVDTTTSATNPLLHGINVKNTYQFKTHSSKTAKIFWVTLDGATHGASICCPMHI